MDPKLHIHAVRLPLRSPDAALPRRCSCLRGWASAPAPAPGRRLTLWGSVSGPDSIGCRSCTSLRGASTATTSTPAPVTLPLRDDSFRQPRRPAGDFIQVRRRLTAGGQRSAALALPRSLPVFSGPPFVLFGPFDRPSRPAPPAPRAVPSEDYSRRGARLRGLSGCRATDRDRTDGTKKRP
jgi:hypothetical protein